MLGHARHVPDQHAEIGLGGHPPHSCRGWFEGIGLSACGLGDLTQSQLDCGFVAVVGLVDSARGPVQGVGSRLAVMRLCLR